MRICIDERKKWTARDHRIADSCRITLNGVPVEFCTLADEELGVVEYLLSDAQGCFVTDKDGVVRVMETGVVRIHHNVP